MKCKHNLEVIASTQHGYSVTPVQTDYLECADCGKLYTRELQTSRGIDIKPRLKEYNGLLNRNQIMDYAHLCQGQILRDQEEEIILGIPYRESALDFDIFETLEE